MQVPGWTEAGQLRTQKRESRLSPTTLQPCGWVVFCVWRVNTFCTQSHPSTFLLRVSKTSPKTAFLCNLLWILVDLILVNQFVKCPFVPPSVAWRGARLYEMCAATKWSVQIEGARRRSNDCFILYCTAVLPAVVQHKYDLGSKVRGLKICVCIVVHALLCKQLPENCTCVNILKADFVVLRKRQKKRQKD